jgi:PAS domain S-box-containing protein
MVDPTGVERLLAPEDIIVSKTDPKGHLTYVNDTFIDISGYGDAELIGKPHNVIRHPEMPRAIFRLLWDTIKDRQEIFAYVMNMSADGSHYWVLAHVTPSIDARGTVIGYHSNRRAPSRAALREIIPLYAQLLREEKSHPNARAATDASSALLEQILADRGQTYDEFVWELISQGEAAA